MPIWQSTIQTLACKVTHVSRGTNIKGTCSYTADSVAINCKALSTKALSKNIQSIEWGITITPFSMPQNIIRLYVCQFFPYSDTGVPLIVNPISSSNDQKCNHALSVQLPLSPQTSVIMLFLTHSCFVVMYNSATLPLILL